MSCVAMSFLRTKGGWLSRARGEREREEWPVYRAERPTGGCVCAPGHSTLEVQL